MLLSRIRLLPALNTFAQSRIQQLGGFTQGLPDQFAFLRVAEAFFPRPMRWRLAEIGDSVRHFHAPDLMRLLAYALKGVTHGLFLASGFVFGQGGDQQF